MVPDKTQQLILPVEIATRKDAGQLFRELTLVDNYFKQAAIRQPGAAIPMPRISHMCSEIVNLNKFSIEKAEDRQQLLLFVESIRTKSPILHMSFSADPSPAFVTKLITWLRQEIHPTVLLQLGLQPTIGAGSVLRTTNKHFDFSLRQRFTQQRKVLVELLHAADRASAKPPVAATDKAASQ